jgi:hypothetical protein
MRQAGNKSKIAQLDYIHDVDLKYTPVIPLNRDVFFARINNMPIKDNISMANIPIKQPEKLKSEKEQLTLIIEKKPSVKKVRKFFKQYIDRLNEEENKDPAFLDHLV